ncbi:MAG: hypothetical protein QN157_03305 [Armatimonadota bacterium]|nr:hypothetical protein [Armatimonadota bacterium]
MAQVFAREFLAPAAWDVRLRDTGCVVVRAGQGVYQVRGPVPLFVVTSRRSLVANLGQCLRRAHRAASERVEVQR